MTNRITLAASEVRVNDHIYNGTGTNAHPTNAWGNQDSGVGFDGDLCLSRLALFQPRH